MNIKVKTRKSKLYFDALPNNAAFILDDEHLETHNLFFKTEGGYAFQLDDKKIFAVGMSKNTPVIPVEIQSMELLEI